jgi:hypothetical protein
MQQGALRLGRPVLVVRSRFCGPSQSINGMDGRAMPSGVKYSERKMLPDAVFCSVSAASR